MSMMPTVVIVPGLRDAVAEHWQTHLAGELRAAGRPLAEVPAMGRNDLSCEDRVAVLEEAVLFAPGPLLLVAHSGGCITVAHWVARGGSIGMVIGALLATPPDFERELPAGYPQR